MPRILGAPKPNRPKKRGFSAGLVFANFVVSIRREQEKKSGQQWSYTVGLLLDSVFTMACGVKPLKHPFYNRFPAAFLSQFFVFRFGTVSDHMIF